MGFLKKKQIEGKILFLREKKVMLSFDLADLYQVPGKVLIQAVKRNKERFPADFMFPLTWEEAKLSRSQFVTLKQGENIKYLPYAFTEQGIAMLSSVLKSSRAIQVNIAIMRAFTRLREYLATHENLKKKIEAVERRFEGKFKNHDRQFQAVFEAIRQLVTPPSKSRRKIGFHP